MKQSILILAMILTLFTSCLEEGITGCPDYLRLRFIYESSTRGYDDVIGNDVHLRLYRNGILHSNCIIPYEEIEGGQEYRIKKEITGNIDIVAWAIPSNEEFVAVIPDVPESRDKIEEKVVMRNSMTRSALHESIGHLYLGTIEFYDADISKEVKVDVPMNSCISQFTAALHSGVEPSDEKGTFWLEVNGFKSEMDLNFKPMGENAIIKAPFITTDEQGILRTAVHGLLPSEEGQFISVKGYQADTHLFTIHTNHQSSPGEIIHVDIFNNHVIIQVNDWRIVDVPIKWI